MHKNNEIDRLISLFAKLPGLGQRSARRIVLHLLQEPDLRLRGFIDVLSSACNNITVCNICGNLDTTTPCNICTDDTRDNTTISVVETVSDLWAMERSNVFKGRYHVLGGVLSASRNTSSDTLRLAELAHRCSEIGAQEVIIATNATIEGQTTAFFIMEYLKQHNNSLYVSRLASGIPIGGELDYLDDGTVSAALNLRQKFIS